MCGLTIIGGHFFMSKTSLVRAVSVLSLLFLLPGCSKGDTAKGKEITIGEETFHVEVDQLVVGRECNYAPFNWTENESNDYTLKISNAQGYADGYDIQVAKKLSSVRGRDVSIVKESWESLITDCQNDSINRVLAGRTDTEERRQSISFSDEYYRSEVVLITRSEFSAPYEGQILGTEELKTLLKGKQVVSQANTVEDDRIDTFVTDYGCHHASAQTSYALAAKDVENGTADFLTVERPVAQNYVQNRNGLGIIRRDQSILGIDLAQLGVSIGVKKENTGLKDALNAALKTISADERTERMASAVSRSSAE
mgnify:FL=1